MTLYLALVRHPKGLNVKLRGVRRVRRRLARRLPRRFDSADHRSTPATGNSSSPLGQICCARCGLGVGVGEQSSCPVEADR